MTALLARPKSVQLLAPRSVETPNMRLSASTCFGIVFTDRQFLKVPHAYRNFFPSLAFEVVCIKQSEDGISILAKPLFDESGLSLFRWESTSIKSLVWQAFNLDETLLDPSWNMIAKVDRNLLALIEDCPFDLI